MRRLLLLLSLAPLTVLAQTAPDPLPPGTFELSVTQADGAERAVEGWAAVHAYPEALGGWTLVLDDGDDLVAVERATAPDLAGAAFADARDMANDDDVRAYLRLDDASAGGYSTGTSPPASRNRLLITETDEDHTIGSFDFAAVGVGASGSETRHRVVGRFHAVADPEGDGGGDGEGGGDTPPIATSADCPDVWDHLGGLYGGLGSWTGYANATNVGGPVTYVDGAMMGVPGWQLQLTNGCNPDFPSTYGYIMSIGHTATPLRAGVYRIVNQLAGEMPGSTEVASGISAPYDRPYTYTSGYVWITSISDGRVRGTYSGYAIPVPHPTLPSPPMLFTYGRFSARNAPPGGLTLPPGVDLPDGVELPPGVTPSGRND